MNVNDVLANTILRRRHLFFFSFIAFLITGSHEDTPSVSNQLFHDDRVWETYTWDRLPASYHGSGCTLASSIAALLAHGLEPVQAVMEAQEYTWNSLSSAYQPGKGQYNPNRFFWMEDGA